MRRRRGTGERRLIKTSCQLAARPESEFAVDVAEVEFNGLRGFLPCIVRGDGSFGAWASATPSSPYTQSQPPFTGIGQKEAEIPGRVDQLPD